MLPMLATTRSLGIPSLSEITLSPLRKASTGVHPPGVSIKVPKGTQPLPPDLCGESRQNDFGMIPSRTARRLERTTESSASAAISSIAAVVRLPSALKPPAPPRSYHILRSSTDLPKRSSNAFGLSVTCFAINEYTQALL